MNWQPGKDRQSKGRLVSPGLTVYASYPRLSGAQAGSIPALAAFLIILKTKNMEDYKTNPNDASFPLISDHYLIDCGLTKREYFAAMAMQGLLANDSALITSKARDAVQAADALIEILNKAKYDD